MRHRVLSSWIALLGILFSQVALSAYACPMLMQANARAGMEPQAEMAGMPCMEHEREADQALLCIQHCENQQTVSASAPVHFPPAIAVLCLAPALSRMQAPALTYVQAPLLAHTTSPPPLWRSRRLRI